MKNVNILVAAPSPPGINPFFQIPFRLSKYVMWKQDGSATAVCGVTGCDKSVPFRKTSSLTASACPDGARTATGKRINPPSGMTVLESMQLLRQTSLFRSTSGFTPNARICSRTRRPHLALVNMILKSNASLFLASSLFQCFLSWSRPSGAR